MERGNARCPHLGSTHEATTTDKGVRMHLEAGEAKATLCFVHGGGFCGQPARLSRSRRFVDSKSAGGCTALLPKYRRAPEFTIEDAVNGVLRAVQRTDRSDRVGGRLRRRLLSTEGGATTSSKPAGVLLWCPYLLHHPTKDVQRSLSSEGDFLDVSSLQPARHVSERAKRRAPRLRSDRVRRRRYDDTKRRAGERAM